MAEPNRKKPLLRLGVNYKEAKNSPPPGLKWVKIKKDQTLGSIADDYGIRALDLMLYNWHTANGQEVNWYLYHYVGARAHNGKTYKFVGNENPGMILVPDVPASVANGPPKVVDVVRDGKAKSDTKLQVYVTEWLASGMFTPVSGKWLYVFSGSGGADFGYSPDLNLPGPSRDEVPGGPGSEPFSAFTLDFPGTFRIREKADKLEYEIYVSSQNAPSSSLLSVVGVKGSPAPNFETGNSWHFLSDPTILKDAKTAARHTRTTHAYRGKANNSLVTVDLSKDRRYYFLLSPVQLGPAAIKFAMDNPAGLTPLLKPGDQTKQWDPSSGNGPDITSFVGPVAGDISSGRITLRVIDPYAWAEDLVESVYAYSVSTYSGWVTSKQNTTIDDLKRETGWTLDHFYLAELVKVMRDNHSKPSSIDSELKDPNKWKADLKKWEEELVQKNATILANVGRDIHQVLNWMDGPGHKIVETAIISDAVGNNSQDAMDIARGLMHWAVCTEFLIAMEPGVVWLRQILSTPGSVPYDLLLKHLKDLDKDTFNWTPNANQTTAYRYAYQSVLQLVVLQDFIAPKPAFTNFNRQEFAEAFGKYRDKRRKNLANFLNKSKILPGKVVIPDAFSIDNAPSGAQQWSVYSASLLSLLDLADKWTTYVIEPDINIPRDKKGAGGKILNRLADLEEWFGKRPTFAKIANLGSSYVLKSAAFGISGYNLYSTITTARFDYQHSVSWVDWASNISGATLAVQDVLAEVGAIVQKKMGSATLARIFPSLMTTAGGPTWGVGAAHVVGIAGRVFAGVNVFAMIISGVTTMVTMGKSSAKSYRNGDYAAATFYGIGAIGGAMMVAGGLAFGYALMTAGGAASATGIGATVGVVLFAVGGIIAGLSALFGWWASSDDFQIFARKCFLGDHGDKEPRWGDDPPEWSLATTSSSNSWPIDKQRAGLMNLFGRFKVKTEPTGSPERNTAYTGDIKFKITPGFFPAGSKVEIALHVGEAGAKSGATFMWEPYDPNSNSGLKADVPVSSEKNGLFDSTKMRASFYVTKGQVKSISSSAVAVRHFTGDTLLATVSIWMGGEKNVIRCRKLVMKAGAVYGMKIGDDEETSDIFK